MVRRRIRQLGPRGFSLAELMVVVAVIGITAAIAMPFMMSYWKAATLKAGAQELATVLNGARQLAIKDNRSVCVSQSGTAVQYRIGGCGSSPPICNSSYTTVPCVWTGPGTDASGWIRLANNVEVSATTANVVFAYLGNATMAGKYTVRNPVDNSTLTVTVATSGRITIP